MAYKDVATRKAAIRAHYYANKAYYLAKNRKIKVANLAHMRAVKNVPCMDCKGVFPYFVMDFDHRDPKAKKKGLTSITRLAHSRKTLEDEIAKCDVICANCHRMRTFKHLL